MKVVYAERAKRDIGGIYDTIAPHNPKAAQRVEDMIRAACEGLAEFPRAGSLRIDGRPCHAARLGRSVNPALFYCLERDSRFRRKRSA